MKSSIGGYFSLELNKKQEFHQTAIRLNAGRNALEYILRVNKYKKIYLPFYSCDVLLEPVNKLGLAHEFYYINNNFEPIFDFKIICSDNAFLYINYFGLNDDLAERITTYHPNIIIDNSQAFFAKALNYVDTFYSPRKFFGVSDGGYLYTTRILNHTIEQDTSYQRMEHLLRRIDLSAEQGYSFFKKNENSLNHQPIKEMSLLTQGILSSIDYTRVKTKRRENFLYLHNLLSKHNGLELNLRNDQVPMVYPFFIDDPEMRDRLKINKIYAALYWKNVFGWVEKDRCEYQFALNIHHLPIDQRYNEADLAQVVKVVLSKG